ncbi:MutS-related protein [Mongoliitalea daihaiensis]|uniref:MutS-related protein n=1 Tax=Mongoliitalea daihaiensis TaxID=2782006 RepID=UPI001F2D7000|nr:DNA mismatch repair protein [Mongoliitalea daihaiensis]UJP65975.1 DNA mismatch repair protein [Mongoliitalea daihaiensis]
MIPSFEPSELLSLKKKSQQKIAGLAILRLIFFLLLITTLILAFAEDSFYILAFIAVAFAFVYLIQLFNQEQDLQRLIRALLQMQEEQKLRAARNLQSLDDGEEFLNKDHPFASDLDLFGKHSLFQLLNHTVTKSARTLLAKRLQMLQPDQDSETFQTVIQELSQKLSFLQLFEGLGKAHHQETRDLTALETWLKEQELWKPIYWVPLFLGPLGGTAVLLATLVGWIPAALVGIWIVLGVGMMAISHRYLKHVAEILPTFSQTKMYRLWSQQIQQEHFEDPYLQKLSKDYRDQQHPVSKGLFSLEQLTFLIQNRFNLMYVVLNAFFWLDFILVRRFVTWKHVYAKSLGGLKDNLDHWQVLVSYATFVNEEALTCLPVWKSKKILRAVRITHPLIEPKLAVGNDFFIEESTQTILLTGANMSGKTTFMRTLGINWVLANQGLPVFATSFESYPFQLFTSMRNSDNLGESVSSFYAELARIKKILFESEQGESVFFLMDEILKGTNTTDRIMGSEALIVQLAATAAKGIISTHDIELSSLEHKHAYLKNYSFHSDIQEDTIQFDYTIKSGPCPSFNAQKLMQLMGIKLNLSK